MVIYFSGTGNSKSVAIQMAKATKDNAKSITDINGTINLQQGESLGIVIPTYFYWVPSVVKEFLENVKIECSEDAYIYCIATCGGTSGQASQMVGKLLEKKGKSVNAYFDIVMPDKCTMCLGCLHRCPTFAIQYGKHTKKHGQYMHP